MALMWMLHILCGIGLLPQAASIQALSLSDVAHDRVASFLYDARRNTVSSSNSVDISADGKATAEHLKTSTAAWLHQRRARHAKHAGKQRHPTEMSDLAFFKEALGSDGADFTNVHLKGAGHDKAVYKATLHGRDVLIPIWLDREDLDGRRLERQSCAYARALHGIPGTTSCEDHMNADNQTGYLIYSDAGRETLEDWLDRSSKKVERKACVVHDLVKVLTKVLRTINGMANRGLVHRDFHFENVVLNDELEPTIIDYDTMLHVDQPVDVAYNDTSRCPVQDCDPYDNHNSALSYIFAPPESKNFPAGLAAACRDSLCDLYDVYTVGIRTLVTFRWLFADSECGLDGYPRHDDTGRIGVSEKKLGGYLSCFVKALAIGKDSSRPAVDVARLEAAVVPWMAGMLRASPRVRDHATVAQSKAAKVLEALQQGMFCDDQHHH